MWRAGGRLCSIELFVRVWERMVSLNQQERINGGVLVVVSMNSVFTYLQNFVLVSN